MSYQRNIGAYLQTEQAALLGNPLTGPYLLSANGAIDPHTPGSYVITKGSICALTLGAPLAGTEDGLQITIYSSTAFQHTLTTAGLLQTGAAAVNTATWSTSAGGQVVLIAFNGKWIADGNGVVFS
jgi:hypothetical protein